MLVDGKLVEGDVPAIMFHDRTLVPIRFVAEAFGATVTWDPETWTVSIVKPQETRAAGEKPSRQVPEVQIPERKQPSRSRGNWRLTYEATFKPGCDVAAVRIILEDPRDEVSGLSLRRTPHGPYSPPTDFITDLRVSAGSLEQGGTFWKVKGAREATMSYTVKLNVPYRGGGYSAYSTDSWVVTAGRFLFMVDGWHGSFNYPERVQVSIKVPEGWEVCTPYSRIGRGLYDATPYTHITPEDFMLVARGDQIRSASAAKGTTSFTVVCPRETAVDPEAVAKLLADVGAVFLGVAGWGPSSVLAVIAPDPVRPFGGEAVSASILAGDTNPFSCDLKRGSATYTHELFHLYQHYYGGEPWIKEGAATYYQYYGLLRSGYISPGQFWDVLTKVTAGRTSPGETLSTSPYQRGALVFMAADIVLRTDSQGKYSLDHVMGYLNAAYEQQEVSSTTLGIVMSLFTGRSYDKFLLDYVRGDQLPTAIFNTAGPEIYSTGP